MLYKMLETAINAREVNGLAEKIEKLFAAGKLTEMEHNELLARVAACEALGKQNGVVMWGGTSPAQLGYDSMLNLVPTNNPCDDLHCGRPFGFVGDFLGNGEPWTCPYEEGCMQHNPDFVVGKFLTLISESSAKKIVEQENNK
jgi:hypothetical protein